MSSNNSTQDTAQQHLPVGVHLPGGLHPDPPIAASNPTIGYRLNHCMLRIRRPDQTLNFYVNLMGMRTIFALNTGPITVYYLGYPQTSEHRADPTTFAQETAPHATLTKTLGLLELCHYHGSENETLSTGNVPPNLGFGHLGFTVPSVPEAVQRLRNAGVKIVKDVGGGPNDSIPITTWEKEEKGVAKEELDGRFVHILKQIAFVEDPDGYLIELVPQEL